jgi:hypothetical protein
MQLVFLFGLWGYWHCGHSWHIVPALGDSEDDCGEQMECRLAGEIEVLEENLPWRHFCPSQNPTWPDPGLNLGRCGGKPATNRRSCGAAMWLVDFHIILCCVKLDIAVYHHEKTYYILNVRNCVHMDFRVKASSTIRSFLLPKSWGTTDFVKIYQTADVYMCCFLCSRDI